jgi:hypothetical protein
MAAMAGSRFVIVDAAFRVSHQWSWSESMKMTPSIALLACWRNRMDKVQKLKPRTLFASPNVSSTSSRPLLAGLSLSSLSMAKNERQSRKREKRKLEWLIVQIFEFL